MLKSCRTKSVIQLCAHWLNILKEGRVIVNALLCSWTIDHVYIYYLPILESYRLVIICSNEGEEKSHFISKLKLHRQPFVLIENLKDYKKYLSDHFSGRHQQLPEVGISASTIDHEK